MTTLDIGRICIKIAGREAGKLCVIVKNIDDNFVLITGPKSMTSVKRRRCNINHLEPLETKISIKSDATDTDVETEYKKGKIIDKYQIAALTIRDIHKEAVHKHEREAVKHEKKEVKTEEKESKTIKPSAKKPEEKESKTTKHLAKKPEEKKTKPAKRKEVKKPAHKKPKTAKKPVKPAHKKTKKLAEKKKVKTAKKPAHKKTKKSAKKTAKK